MNDPIFKQKYQKYKIRVKLWEKDFKKKNGRIPSKYDIREASQVIRDSYKMYYKLKTSFLEDTLNDVLSDDGFDILEMSQKEDVSLTNSIIGAPQLPFDITTLVQQHDANDDQKLKEKCGDFSVGKELLGGNAPTTPVKCNDNQVIINFEPVAFLPLNESAWNPNLSKKSQTNEKIETKQKNSKPDFKEKLFKNSSFSKRNPRKSFSKPILVSSLQSNPNKLTEMLNTNNKEVLPDLETILLQKAKEQASTKIALNPLLTSKKIKENVKTQVDEGWLERNAGHNINASTLNLSNKDSKTASNNLSSPIKSKKSVYGLTNLDISKLQTKYTPVIEQSLQLPKINESSINVCFGNEKPKVSNLQAFSLDPVNEFQIAFKSVDSDSVVDDSDEEKESSEYRHIKRKKCSPSTKPSSQENTEDSLANSNNKKCENLKNNTSESAQNPDDEKRNKPKRKVKKSVAKASSAKPRRNTTKKGIKEKKNVPPKGKNIKTNSRSSKKGKVKSVEMQHNEFESKPLKPDDLKYALALESGELTSVPRIKQKELNRADTLAQKYINSSNSLSKPIPAIIVDEKRAAERRKLEDKIATGKLSENFVTINIQKKTFVRGKKNMNYSKYKKKLWKHKKHIAALTGPNMDMRGCDGGTLKCFTCGQAGHFAQKCKLKGDSLLPLTAQLEIDDSPFPTLEEAERMASQSAVPVHSRNISKLPEAPNAAIYNQSKSCETNNKNEVKVSSIDSDIDRTSDEEHLPSREEIRMETDDELENFDVDSASLGNQNTISPIKKYIGSKIPDEFLKAAGINPSNPNPNNSTKFSGVDPLYELNTDGTVQEVTSEVLETLKMFGHTNFRKGQDRAVMRILSGMSTLVTLSTGSGKSLCYQLPAYLYSKHKKSITLVISPLVSLMEDQVTGVPHFLRAYCLHTNQTPQQKHKIMTVIADGDIDVLLVSPEAVVAGERSTGFGSILRQLPPIAFACIDEAHCVSQWSHNFRPSYLMICKVLKQNLGVKCVLGLTATATLPTRMSIIHHLSITDGEKGIISDIPLPDNLILSVSKDGNRDHALLHLLLSKRFAACHSIIIYCTRRDECERIAAYLRTCLQDNKPSEQESGQKKRKRVNWQAEPYHAGMPASRRRTIQNAFMCNELRIVVATIAFGMGINKPDIRAVIHYNMPRNFESYVQEVGRAGRDNKISHCHLFLDANGGDQYELKRHIYANSLDRHVIRKLLQRIFVSCSCDKNLKKGVFENSTISKELSKEDDLQLENEGTPPIRPHICKGHEIGFSIEETVEALDIPEENISTLLCYMELDNRWGINILSNAYMKGKVISYGGPKYLKYAAKECPPLAMAIAMEINKGSFKEDANIIEFSVVDVAAAIGWNSGVVKYQLKTLEWVQVGGTTKRSPITVTFYDLGFRLKVPGDFTVEEIDDALDTLYNRSVKQEHTQLVQLQYIYQGLSSVAYNSYSLCSNETFSHDRSDQLKGIIRDYFCNDYPKNLRLEVDPSNTSDGELESDVIALINMYPENNFSGRNVARLFHGISSPNYPALMWYRCKFWRAHSKTDFNRIVQLANNVIVRRRT